MQDERNLLARARKSDQEALAAIHDRYYEILFHFISFRVNDRQTADDLTSEVFVRLLKAIRNRSIPNKNLTGWLYTIAGRLVIDYYRKENRVQLIELDKSLTDRVTPDQVVERRIQREDVQRAMYHLTEEQQTVIGLRFGWEMSVREVADFMRKSEGAVKQMQLRALASLAQLLSVESHQ